MAPAIAKPLLSDLVARSGRVPSSYIRPVGDRPDLANVDHESGAGIPLIDRKQLDGPERHKVVEAIASACETDGSFMVTNHGIPEAVVEGILHVAREFFHLPESERLKCYSDDPKKAIRPSTSFNVRTEKVSNWRDFLRLHCYPLESFISQWPSKPPAFSMGMDYGPNSSKDFVLIEAKECYMDRRLLNKTNPKLVSEFVRIRPSGGNEHWRESMLALGILFEGPSTPAAESSSVDTVLNRVLFLDSAAGRHMVSHAALLSNPRDPPAGMDRVRTADGTLLPVVGYGDIQMEGFDIPDVCLVRGLEFNLISVGQLASSHNICSCFFGDQCNLMLSDGRLIGGAFRRNDNQYILRFLEIP